MAKSGTQSPTSFSKHLDKTFEEAQYSGVINLSNKNLKEYPRCKKKYDLIDTSTAGKFVWRIMYVRSYEYEANI